MDTKWKVVIVTIVAGLIGMQLQATSPLGKNLWPETSGEDPTSAQLPFLIVVGVLEGIAFGLGVAFLFFGWSRVTSTPGVSKGLSTAAAAGITWGLVSWIPHSAMHQTNAEGDFWRLIGIEYLFHVTLIAFGAVLALFAYRAAQAAAGKTVAPKETRKPLVAMR